MDREVARQLLRRVIDQTEKEAKRKIEVVSHLRKTADEMDVKQRDMDIAKISFASSGIVGTGLTIAGIAAAPFTFGASLGLTVAGIAVGVGSGLGGLSTSIADWIINGNTMKEAQAKIDEYQETVNILVDLLEQVKNSNIVEFHHLVSEELADMEANQRLTLESTLTGLKTGVEVVGSAGRSAALAGAVAARATVAAGRTMMEAMETGMKAVKIGGVVLSVLTVPLDLHTMVTNSIKIHKSTPSETAEKIRQLATNLEKYRMIETNDTHTVTGDQTSLGEVKTLKQEVQSVVPDLKKMEEEMEQMDEVNRRRKQKLKQHLKRLVEKVPTELNELAMKYDKSNSVTNLMKLLLLVTQVFGSCLIVTGITTGLMGVAFDHILKYGVITVIGGGLLLLMLEMYTEMTNSSIWNDAELELERYFHTIQVLTDLNRAETDDNESMLVEDTFGIFRTNLQSGRYIKKHHWDFALLALKLILDTFTLVFTGRFQVAVDGTVDSVEGTSAYGLVSVETALSYVAFPITVFTNMEICTAAAFVYILTLPISVYLLFLRWAEIRGNSKSKVAEAMNNLGEDFAVRFHHMSLDYDE